MLSEAQLVSAGALLVCNSGFLTNPCFIPIIKLQTRTLKNYNFSEEKNYSLVVINIYYPDTIFMKN